MPTDTPAAFFSYSREDKAFAQQLAADLKAAGANVWMDELDIEPGQRWDRSVRDALARCPRMLVVLSPASVDSENVLDEIDFALEKHKTIIPVLHRDCETPLRLRRVQYIDFREVAGGEGSGAQCQRGLKTLLKVLGVEQAMAASATAPATPKEARPAAADSGVRRLVAEQVELELQRRLAADRARQDEEREQAAEATRLEEEQRQAAEQARLEEERKQAAEHERLEEEKKQAAERARLEQEELDRQAAEKARLEQEARERRAEEEKARLEREERERQAAAEKARLEAEERKRQAAAEKARLEREERVWQAAVAEKARLEQQERELQAAQKARIEQQARQRLEAEPSRADSIAEPAVVSPAFKKVAAAVVALVVLILFLIWVNRPKQSEVAKQPPQEYRSQASNPPPAAETSSNKPLSEAQSSEAKLETPKSAAESRPPSQLSKKSGASATAKTSYPSKPAPTPPDPRVSRQIAAAITEGDWHKRRGEYQEAINSYQKGLALDPSNAELKRKIQEARSAKQAEDQILGKNPSGT